jgi:3-oxoadipate enol-lactonase
MTPPAQAEVIAKAIAGAKVATIDAAHIANMEQPQVYTRTVLDFLLG